MTAAEISKGERLAKELRENADNLDRLVRELKAEAVRIADSLMEAREHGYTLTLGHTHFPDAGSERATRDGQ